MTIGYIVEALGHGAMVVGYGKDITLYFGRGATVFDTRRKAKRSIDATIKKRPTFEQEFGKLRIVHCESGKVRRSK